MAAPRKKPNQSEPPKPINCYGLPDAEKKLQMGWRQHEFDMLAFIMRWPVEKGGLPRYEHFRNIQKVLLPDIEWNPWLEDQIRSLCENRWVGWSGAASCVAGETRILNPLTGETPTIQYLCENRIAPWVMTLDGPIQAEVPFVKGEADLFEVVLENGSSFHATSEHKVLSQHGFCRVSDLQISQSLFSYEPNHRESISEHALSIRGQDALCFQKKVEGSQGNCSVYSRPCDEQLLFAREAYLSSSPSQDDAQERILRNYDWDGHFDESQCIHPWLCSSRRASLGFVSHRNSLDTSEPLHCGQETGEPESLSYQPPLQFRQEKPYQQPFSGLTPDFSRKHYSSCGQALTQQNERAPLRSHSLDGMVTQSKVASIRKTGLRVFYDITVPKAHHYFAEGAIHHNSGKTFGASLYATIWWLCAPDISSVILTSTTKGMIRKRMWANIQKFHTSMPGERFGNFKDSITTWQAKKGDDKHAIFAIAVADGQTSKAVANIQGVHTRRQLLIIDEATDTPEAAFDACANLYSGPQDFQLLVIGNPASHFDPMGKFCEPKNGWKSVNVDTDEWETKPQLDGNPGLVVRFDAEKSPNFKLGETKYTYLVTRSQLVNARRKYGEASPLYWKFYRGFWCPDGTKTTVLNETLIAQMNGMSRHVFIGKATRTSSLDPAFGGGDLPIQTFGTLGDMEAGKKGFHFDEQVELKVDASRPLDVHYQLARQFIDNCKAKGVLKRNAGVLTAGEGGGLASIIQQMWDEPGTIITIEEGGRPSDSPVNNEDDTPCVERYERKNVELWYTCRILLESGQLKGLLPEMSKEFCQREFDASKRKIRLQTKKEMKESLGFSPDHADSAGACVEVARMLGLTPALLGQTAKRHEVVDRNVKESQEIYDEQNLYQPETAEDLEELAA